MFQGDRIIVQCDYREFDHVKKTIGGRFVGPDSGGPGLKFVLSMDNCKMIRERIPDAVFSDELIKWGRTIQDEAVSLVELAAMHDVDDLTTVEQRIPEMFEKLRHFQRVGVKFVAEAPNPLVADDPGLGKTWEVIGGVFEAGLADGPNLVVCPKIAIETVWLYELHRFQDNPVFVAPEGRKERERLLEEVEACLEIDQPFWLVVNPQMLTYRRAGSDGIYDSLTGEYYQTQFPFLMRTHWNTVIVDEAHDCGLANPQSQTARALHNIIARKRIAMTGTPMGGKPMRLWGILHWLEPDKFQSQYRWRDKWLDVELNQTRDGRRFTKVGGIRPGMEEKFYKEHAHYMLRRKKEDVYKEMPPKNHMPIWVNMTEEQVKQYRMMENEAETRLAEAEEAGAISSPNVLTTYAWLKQFSFGFCDVYEKGKVWDDKTEMMVMKYGAKATANSPKLEALVGLIRQLGMFDEGSTEQVVVFTQFKHVADLVYNELDKAGLKVAKITGDTSDRAYRADVQERFQNADNELRIVVMTTKAGGVAINLDRADTVVFLDETWNPDDQVQAEDRCHRASRIHNVSVYTIRTKDSIDQDVLQAVDEKRDINDILLDRFRKNRAKPQEEEETVEW